jgi:2-polyprenyl-3-methyl-5-hydroxy-6-metoxy-1,4-benzoquinol methylase
MFRERSTQTEIMDDLSLGGEEMDQTLRELEIINRWLGGDAITINGLKRIINKVGSSEKLSIADLGCGGGDTLLKIAEWGKKKRLNLKLTGIDANPEIIAYAKNHCRSYPDIQFGVMNIFSPEFQKEKFDIITTSLFTHHFTSDELEILFKNWKKQASMAVLINDLHRHPLAYYSISALTAAFSRSNMVKNDGKISVLRGFRRAELRNILAKAGIQNYTLDWKWAFRWQLIYFPE